MLEGTWCRCPGCGKCDAAEEADSPKQKLRKRAYVVIEQMSIQDAKSASVLGLWNDIRREKASR